MRRFFYNLSALSLIGIIAVSCHKDPVNPLPKDIPVTGVSINETSLSMLEGDSESLVATVSPDNATNKKVNWSSSKVSVVSVDQSGRITAEAPGTAVITVTTEDGGKTATCAVSVAVRIYPVNSVSLDMTEVNLSKGGTQTLKATINPFNASNKNVSWSSSDEIVAIVSQSGEVEALSAGTAVITVTTEDGGKTATCSVTVTEKIYPVSEVTLDKTELSLVEGDKGTLTATINPSNASNKNVSWSSSDETVAIVSQSGEVEALSAGTAVITVTTEDGGKTATCAVSVAVRIYPVNSVSLDMTEVSLSKGGTQTLKATINPFNASNKNVSWSSSDNTVATVSQGGVVKAVSSGLAVITVTTEDGGKKAACRVTVLSDNNLEDPTDGGEEWKWD